MIHDQPRDIDRSWPDIPGRGTARQLLDNLIADEATAQQVWNNHLGPLYDMLAARDAWPKLRCRTCSAYHPQHPNVVMGLERRTEHRMSCSKYVGPLVHKQHKIIKEHASGVPRAVCECGAVYPPSGPCPDRSQTWRGPR